MKKKFLITFFLFITITYYAQNPEKKLGSWYMYNGSNRISESFSIRTSAHVRYFELVEFYQQEIYRLGVNYKIHKRFNVAGGMVYSTKESNYKGASNKINEYRFYEDFKWRTNYKSLIIRPRIRLEHSSNSSTNFQKFNHRIRFRTRLQHPIFSNTLFYVFDEIFLNFEPEVFGENRIGAGFIHTVSKPLKFRLGYMHIDFGDSYLNRLQIGVIINTDLRRKNT